VGAKQLLFPSNQRLHTSPAPRYCPSGSRKIAWDLGISKHPWLRSSARGHVIANIIQTSPQLFFCNKLLVRPNHVQKFCIKIITRILISTRRRDILDFFLRRTIADKFIYFRIFPSTVADKINHTFPLSRVHVHPLIHEIGYSNYYIALEYITMTGIFLRVVYTYSIVHGMVP
jgi:hypothetical protein